MKYLSVCSGIEAATVAWHHMDWQPVGFSEIEKFPSQVLAHHYPSVPNLGDMTKFKEWDIGAIDLLVGGTPCQSFSVAGLRKGLEDPRGNLALTYCAILDKFKPKWFVWENVPGVLSSNGGRDFGAFLGAVAELGYGFAYRVCDAQWFGVPQRRRRVFVVGCFGDWRSAAAVLFEPESLRWDLAPRREKGQTVAPTVVQGPPYSRTGNERVECDAMVAVRMVAFGEYVEDGTASAMKARDYKDATDLVAQVVGALACNTGPNGHDAGNFACNQAVDAGHVLPVAQPMVLMDQGGSVMNVMEDGTVGTLRRETHGHEPCVVQPVDFRNLRYHDGDVSGTMQAKSSGGYSLNYMTGIQQEMAVRRLTPTECERLQGFPDGYTDIQPNGKPTPDGPRYKALGNSMAVPVMKWIGEGIDDVSSLA